MPPQTSRLQHLLPLLLCLPVITAYYPLAGNGFLYNDDPFFITHNPMVQNGFSLDSVNWALTSFHTGNWHPLTWFSHMLDVELFGLQPAGHHLMNLLFHLANTMLVFLLFRTFSDSMWKCMLAAALFGLHPMHVESVAWASERKDVLSLLFGLAAMLAHMKSRLRGGRGYGLATILLFFMSLASKPMCITLPLLLMLLSCLPATGRNNQAPFSLAGLGREFMAALPLFAIALAFGVMTILTQDAAGAVNPFPLSLRLSNALVAYCWYVLRFFAPLNLGYIYSFPIHIPLWQPLASLLFLAAASALFLARRKDQPLLLIGWLWFLIAMAPMIGIIQVGNQAMADRYTYLPYIGLSMTVIWGMALLLKKIDPRIQWGLWCLALAACGMLTWQHAARWKDSPTIIAHTVSVTTDNYVAYLAQGQLLGDQGRLQEALLLFQLAEQSRPGMPSTLKNLAVVHYQLQHFDQAVQYFERYVLKHTDDATAYQGLALSYMHMGMLDKALEAYINAYVHAPESSQARHDLLAVMEMARRRQESRTPAD